MSDDLRQPRDFDYADRVERDAQADRAYLFRLERKARHSPAPDCVWHCDEHGPHRHILGCPKCADEDAA